MLDSTLKIYIYKVILPPLIQEELLSDTRECMWTKYWVTCLVNLSLPRKSVVRLTDCSDMTIAVDWDVKTQTKQSKNQNKLMDT